MDVTSLNDRRELLRRGEADLGGDRGDLEPRVDEKPLRGLHAFEPEQTPGTTSSRRSAVAASSGGRLRAPWPPRPVTDLPDARRATHGGPLRSSDRAAGRRIS